MQLTIDGKPVFAATGGRTHESGRPLALFVHGAGLDHTVWALQSRWLAFHCWNVLAVDLPGHGRSDGAPLPDIPALSSWVVSVIAAVAADAATLIGHSMGSLVALDAAANHAGRVDRLILIGAAASMPVHADLLNAAAANDHAAIDMVNLWGFGFDAGIGGSRAPGVWMVGAGERTLERARPGVLHSDLAACNAYRDGLAAAAQVAVPSMLICGEKDMMTPSKNGRALAKAIPRSTYVELSGAGHMLMAERPYEVLDTMARHLAEGIKRR
jgi:pimeloyl-ACP methyl ester carboxylesterase